MPTRASGRDTGALPGSHDVGHTDETMRFFNRGFSHPLWLGLVLVLCLVLAETASAQNLPGMDPLSAQENTDKAPDPDQLKSSLDDVISTLENDRKRDALVSQLKQLRETTAAEADTGAGSVTDGGGLLGALADSISDLSDEANSGAAPFDIWQRRANAALSDARALAASPSRAELARNLGEIAIGLAIWITALILLIFGLRRLFIARGWPVTLPPEPRPWMLLAHFARRVFPWLITFGLLLASVRLLEAATPARATLLVAAYVALCGRLLSTVFDVVIALFTRGHRRVAVSILHDKALATLFFVGMLVAFGDAVHSSRMSQLLGANLADWLSVMANLFAALLSGVLILRIRRPVAHLISNRRLPNRLNNQFRDLVVFAARLWHVPALLLIIASLGAILTTGGQADAAFGRAMLCTVFLVLALVIAGVIRRQHERAARRTLRSHFANRLRHLGFVLAHCVVWLLFAELSLRVWGFSLLGLGEPGATSARIGHALLRIGLTVLIAWLIWIAVDGAIHRALHGKDARGRRRNSNRAQTITPMIRNIALFTILIIAGIAGLANLGVNVTPLLAGAGVIGIALGFGAQSLVADLITGIFILIEDSLAVGDFVEMNGYMGTVEGLNLRTVRLRDLDGVVHITTFSHIDAIHNMSRQFGIALMKIRIPYDLRIDDAIELMRRAAADLHRDPFMRGLIRSHLEMQGIHEFDNGCPILRMRLRTAPEYQWDVSRAFNLALKRRMEAEYINLGAPRMSVTMEAGGGTRYGKRGKPVSEDSTGTTNLDWPTDDAPSPTPDPG
ncbi:mechanosensitive ion channel domain-containing protein [Salinisphaera sp. Q1T1-3]|uniref:mechanosensitive ion channel domain-containing protein n=1 Tax=Salinisphaera sp. Q1T1-3 TaxID=2321229 RepID=UPI0013143FF2|nr:mechanosensitive ion channel domain-containing protein [Salinisphaera sp. Q1T1-3]